jgi:hypothetical protein
MKTKSKIRGLYSSRQRSRASFSGVVVAVSSAINLSSQPPKFLAPENNATFGVNGQENRSLSFADRVAYQPNLSNL